MLFWFSEFSVPNSICWYLFVVIRLLTIRHWSWLEAQGFSGTRPQLNTGKETRPCFNLALHLVLGLTQLAPLLDSCSGSFGLSRYGVWLRLPSINPFRNVNSYRVLSPLSFLYTIHIDISHLTSCRSLLVTWAAYPLTLGYFVVRLQGRPETSFSVCNFWFRRTTLPLVWFLSHCTCLFDCIWFCRLCVRCMRISVAFGRLSGSNPNSGFFDLPWVFDFQSYSTLCIFNGLCPP